MERSSEAHPLPPGGAAEIDRFRSYLRVLAEIELSPRLRSKVDPSDIVQQSLLEAHRALHAFKGRTEPELIAWLRTILAHNLLNTAREFSAKKRDVRREQQIAQQLEHSSLRLEHFLAAEQTSPSQHLVRAEQIEELADALAELPDDQRTAVILKHFHDWPLAQIAEHMDRSTLAVAGLLKRGLKKLRTTMNAEGERNAGERDEGERGASAP
jgi:RNA polymerase sigma-70 factor (ECF subfamily)